MTPPEPVIVEQKPEPVIEKPEPIVPKIEIQPLPVTITKPEQEIPATPQESPSSDDY